MNLVVGATGLLGSEICRLLAAEGGSTRALVRSTSDPEKVAELESLGIEIGRGDLKDWPSLEAACQGATTVVSTANSVVSRAEGDSIQTVDVAGQLNLIEAAKTAGVGRFVFVSLIPSSIDFPFQDAKRSVERCLMNSGLEYTILQPTNFMEVWLSPAFGLDAVNGTARICGSGESKISWISFKDVAKFAVASLKAPEARNAVIKLGGPEALSLHDVVRIFEGATDREFALQYISEEDLRKQKEGSHDPLQQSFAALMLNSTRDCIVDMTDVVKKFPMRLTSVRDLAGLKM